MSSSTTVHDVQWIHDVIDRATQESARIKRDLIKDITATDNALKQHDTTATKVSQQVVEKTGREREAWRQLVQTAVRADRDVTRSALARGSAVDQAAVREAEALLKGGATYKQYALMATRGELDRVVSAQDAAAVIQRIKQQETAKLEEHANRQKKAAEAAAAAQAAAAKRAAEAAGRESAAYRELASMASNADRIIERSAIKRATAVDAALTSEIDALRGRGLTYQQITDRAVAGDLVRARSAQTTAATIQASMAKELAAAEKLTAATSERALTSAGAGAASAATGGATAGAAKTAKKAGGLAAGGAGMLGFAGAFGAASLVGGAVGYQAQLSELQAVSEATAKQKKEMDQLARDLGAKTAFSASESAAALTELARAGFTSTQAMKALPGTMDLAAASGMNLADTATIQSDALRGFGLNIGDAQRVADVFALAVNKSSIEMSDLGYTLKYMAPIAHTTGQSFEDMTAAVAILGNVGIRGDTAGTSLRTLMVNLVKPTKKSKEALDELGLSVKDLQGPNGLLPLPDILEKIVAGADKLPRAEQLKVLSTVFGKEPIAGITTLVDKGAPALRKLSDELLHADGAADRMGRTMQDNAKFGFEQFTGALETAAITAEARFEPQLKHAFTSAADSVGKFTSNADNMREVEDTISAAASAGLSLVHAVTPLVRVGADAVTVFGDLPSPIKTAAFQFGLLYLVTRKVAGSAAFGALTGSVGRLRGQLKALPAEAAAAEAAISRVGATPPVRPTSGPRTGPVRGVQTYQTQRGLGDTRRGAFSTAASSTLSGAVAGRGRAIGKGAAVTAAAGGLGAVVGGGDPLSGAVSGAAAGSMAGPWGALAGGVAGALGSAIYGWIDDHGKDAGLRLGKQIAPGVSKALQTTLGDLEKDARNLDKEAAKAKDRSKQKTRYITAPNGMTVEVPFSDDDRKEAAAEAKRKTAEALAARRNFGIKAAITGPDSVAKQAMAHGDRGMSTGAIMGDFNNALGKASLTARSAGAAAIVNWAKGMADKGRLPKSAVERIAQDIGDEFPDVKKHLAKLGVDSTTAFADGLKSPSAAAAGRKVITQISKQYDDMPKVVGTSAHATKLTLDKTIGELKDKLDHTDVTGQARKNIERDLAAARKALHDLKDAGVADTKVLNSLVLGGFRDELADVISKLDEAKRKFDDLPGSLGRLPGSPGADPSPSTGPFQSPMGPFPVQRTGGPVRFAAGGMVPTLMSGGEMYLDPGTVAAYDRHFPGALAHVESYQPSHFAQGGPVGAKRYALGGSVIPGPSDRDGTFVAAQPGAFVLTGGGQDLLAQITGGGMYAGGGKVRAAKVGYTVFDDPPPGAFGSLANGYAELGTARRTDGGATGFGWIAKALGLSGELKAHQALTVAINGHTKTLQKGDRGYGQGGDGRTSDSNYALDVWKDNWGAFGLNANSKGTATVALGANVRGVSSGDVATRSHEVTKITDDLKSFSAREAARSMYRWRQGAVPDAFSQGFDAARAGETNLRYIGGAYEDALAAARVQLTKTTSTVAGKAAKENGTAAGGTFSGFGGRLAGHPELKDGVSRAANTLIRKFGLTVSSTTGGTHAKDSYHYRGRAVDLVGNRMGAAAKWVEGTPEFYRALAEGIHNPGLSIKNGKKVGSGFWGAKTWAGHGNHIHMAARRGGRILPRFARGGGVSRKKPKYVEPTPYGDSTGFYGTPSMSRGDYAQRATVDRKTPFDSSLKALFGAGSRDNAGVTDALDHLTDLLNDTETATIKRLQALSGDLDKTIRSVVAKSSPGGAKVTKEENALVKRAMSAKTLANEALGVRAGTQAQIADEIGKHADQTKAMQDRDMRRLGIDESSSTGLLFSNVNLAGAETAKRQQAGALQAALKTAKSRGRGGADQAKAIQDELDGLNDDIADIAVQRVENARALVRQQAQDNVDTRQFDVDWDNAGQQLLGATQRVTGADQTPEGMRQMAVAKLSSVPHLAELKAAQEGQALTAFSTGDVKGWQSAMLAATQTATDMANAQADAAETIKAAAAKEAATRTRNADFGLSVGQAKLTALELRQKLDGTYDGGGADRAAYITNSLLPEAQKQLAADQYTIDSELGPDGHGMNSEEYQVAVLKLLSDSNAFAQLQLDAQEAIKENTDTKQIGGTLGFADRGENMTDTLFGNGA